MDRAQAPTAAALLDVVQELVCVVGRDGAISWASSGWARELRLDPAQLVGRLLPDLAHPEDRERLALELMVLRERGNVAPAFECRMPSGTGTALWIRWTGASCADGLVLSGRDVTALREPDRGRTELLAAALDAIVSIDAHDRIVEFNPSAERTFGFSREEALGRRLAELLLPPVQREAHVAGVRRVAEGGPFRLIGKRLELDALRADGTEFPAELTITQTSTDPFRVTAFVRDLSEELAIRGALRESEARYAQAFDQAPVGIALFSIDPATPGRLIRVNGALCAMLGTGQEELLAGSFDDVTHPDDVAADRGLLAEVLAGRRTGYELEKRFLRGDGSVTWALVHGTVAHDREGTALYGIGQVQDITIRKAAESALRENQERLARTERLARIGAWEWDIVEDRFSWSTGLAAIFGPLEAARAPSLAAFYRVVHPEDREQLGRAIEEVRAGRSSSTTWQYRTLRNREIAHIFSWGEVVLAADGTPRAVHGYAQDVTERHLAQERVEGLRRDNDRILDTAGEGIVRLDASGHATFVNPAAARALGYAPADLIGRCIHDVVHQRAGDGAPHSARECPFRHTAAGGETRRGIDDVLSRRDGSALPVEYTSSPMLDGDRVTGAVIVFSDVTERRELEERLREFAEVDALTGLMNRRRFEEALAEYLADGSSDGGALLLLDLDHFKFVNDSFGHAAGDNLIRVIADVLAAAVRDGDVLARLNGDEFAVLLPKAETAEAAVVARRLVAGIEQARPSGLQVGASVGATCFDSETATTAGDLLVAADIALYEAKERGRGRVEFFAGRPGASLTWVQRIRTALDEDRLVLHAQPIVDLATGETTQEELLVRMVDEQGAIVAPAQFLPTAETFGLIGDIDRWVVAQGVAFAAAGRCVHVNLSGRSVGSQVLLAELTELLRSSGADPANLIFELTETVAITNMTDARAFAEGLHRLGCRLALDDFGTGFGSFTYLRNLPADLLKIDMDFVRNLASSAGDRRVVEAIVDIAARFGLSTVAEGVEDPDALELLRDAGVDYAQGYLLGRPSPT